MMLVRAVAVWLVLLGGIAVADDDEAQHILVTFEDPGMSHSARPGPARPGYSRRSGTYLVSFSVRRAADRVARDFDLQIVDEWPIVPLNVHCLVYAVPDDVALDSLLTDLRQRPEVESAQLLNRFQVQGTPPAGSADPYGKLQHNLETMEVSQAHAWTRGAGSRVTIIDTGIDLQHPELVTQVREHHDHEGSGEAHMPQDPAEPQVHDDPEDGQHSGRVDPEERPELLGWLLLGSVSRHVHSHP